MKRAGTASKAELIRKALRLFDLYVSETQRGNELLISSNGDTQRIVIL